MVWCAQLGLTSLLGCHLFNRSPSPPHRPWRGPAHSHAGVVVGFYFTGVIEPTHILPAPARPSSHPPATGINGFTLPCLAGNGLRKRMSVCHPKPAAVQRARSRWQPHVPLHRARCSWDRCVLEGWIRDPQLRSKP